MAKQAENIDKGGRQQSGGPSTATKTSKSGKKKEYKDQEKVSDENNRKNDKAESPKCLNDKCDKLHYIKDCDITVVDEKKRLIKKYREEKAKRAAKRVQGDESSSNKKVEQADNSTLFETVFAEKVHTVVCADLGSDINLMCPGVLHELETQKAKLTVEHINPPMKFELAVTENIDGCPAMVECNKSVKLNIELKIRHGSSLTLRNVTWFVATKKMPQQLLSRPVLEFLGVDATEALIAAYGRHEGQVDMNEFMPEDDSGKQTVARLMNSQGILH